MSGETEASVSGWSVDTLHSHLIRLIQDRDQQWNARFSAQEQAIRLAREAELALQTGNSQVLQTRIDAIETAQISFEARITRVPTEVDVKVDHLRGLMDEKFNSLGQQIVIRDQNINQRFDERDVRSDRESLDNKTAVNAAFAAAKEAVAEQNKSSALAISKSEASTTKQIDQIGVQIATTTKATDEKNSDLKDQIARLQVGPVARREGSDATRVSFQWAIATGVMVLAVLLTFLASHFH